MERKIPGDKSRSVDDYPWAHNRCDNKVLDTRAAATRSAYEARQREEQIINAASTPLERSLLRLWHQRIKPLKTVLTAPVTAGRRG